jgi:hypothetical protein
MDMRSVYKISVDKPEGKRPLGRIIISGRILNRLRGCGLDLSSSG